MSGVYGPAEDCGNLSITSNANSFTLSDGNTEVIITLKYESSEDAPQWVVSKTETTFKSLGEALEHVGVVVNE